MKRFYPFVFDFLLLVGIILLFQSYTNQKNFKLDVIGLGIFSFLCNLIFYRKTIKVDPYRFFTLFLVILLTCFVFLKIAEYDPIQIFPQKLGIKLVTLVWILFILISFNRLTKDQFSVIGPLLSIVPVISFINFMAYPSVPIYIALLLSFRGYIFHNKHVVKFPIIVLVLFFIILSRDWWDDFGLQRGVLLFEAFLFFHLIRNWENNLLVYFLKSCILFFLLNSIFIFWGIAFDSNFHIASYKEDVYLIPVSLLASNALLVVMMCVLFWLLPNQKKIEKVFLVLAFLSAILWFGITVSRNSIVSFLIFISLILYSGQDSERKKKITYILSIVILIVGCFLFFFSQKSIFNLASSAVRLSIWGFYVLNTFVTHPLIGFGLYPENKISFASSNQIDLLSMQYIKEYIANFESFPLAHNLYVQFFGTFGIIGTVLVLLYIFKSVLENQKVVRYFKDSNLWVSISLGVWLLHEMYDFNSIEISNLFVLVGIMALYKTDIKNINPQTYSTNSNVFKFGFIASLLLLLTISFRFAYVDHYTLKYAKLVTPHNFEFYKSRNDVVNQIEAKLPTFSKGDYQFFGNKFFFYNFAAQNDMNSKLEHLKYCFELQKYPAICYSKLIGLQNEEQYYSELKPTFRFFLSLYDPFDIYKRESL
ncbi:O-antigen ligase family protein [Leptospira sp. WS39.C2]